LYPVYTISTDGEFRWMFFLLSGWPFSLNIEGLYLTKNRLGRSKIACEQIYGSILSVADFQNPAPSLILQSIFIQHPLPLPASHGRKARVQVCACERATNNGGGGDGSRFQSICKIVASRKTRLHIWQFVSAQDHPREVCGITPLNLILRMWTGGTIGFG